MAFEGFTNVIWNFIEKKDSYRLGKVVMLALSCVSLPRLWQAPPCGPSQLPGAERTSPGHGEKRRLLRGTGPGKPHKILHIYELDFWCWRMREIVVLIIVCYGACRVRERERERVGVWEEHRHLCCGVQYSMMEKGIHLVVFEIGRCMDCDVGGGGVRAEVGKRYRRPSCCADGDKSETWRDNYLNCGLQIQITGWRDMSPSCTWYEPGYCK
jgi:hypothetical protein